MHRKIYKAGIGWFFLLLIPMISHAQTDSTLTNATLANVIAYALDHQPAVQQALIDKEITNKVIHGKLADWYPQINATFNLQRNFDRPVLRFGESTIRPGTDYTSAAQFTVNQTIFSRDVLLASSTASDVRRQSELSIDKSRIDLTANVMKAFYDVLATEQQIRVAEESIIRLKRSQRDANSRYQAGISDKTDVKRATILLGNAEVTLKSNRESLTYKEAYLKNLMGYPIDKLLSIYADTLQMESEILLDTVQNLNYAVHIDYKLLKKQHELQDANVRYSKWAFLPTLSAFGAYNLNYLNDDFNKLYKPEYPNSYVGATLSIPIFQGGKRVTKIQEQKLTSKRLDFSITNLENTLSTEYTRSMAAYKINLQNYLTQKENVLLAQEVYDIIQLQYVNGVKTYLDVITAESDLNTTRINYYNSLYQILASKVDVLRALGQINY